MRRNSGGSNFMWGMKKAVQRVERQENDLIPELEVCRYEFQQTEQEESEEAP